MDASHMYSSGDKGNMASVAIAISGPSTPAGFLWRGSGGIGGIGCRWNDKTIDNASQTDRTRVLRLGVLSLRLSRRFG